MIPESTYQMPEAIENDDAIAVRRVQRRDADPETEHGQQDLDDEADDDAGEDRSPGNPVDHDGVGVFVGGRL